MPKFWFPGLWMFANIQSPGNQNFGILKRLQTSKAQETKILAF
jgi:hypothetical protein